MTKLDIQITERPAADTNNDAGDDKTYTLLFREAPHLGARCLPTATSVKVETTQVGLEVRRAFE